MQDHISVWEYVMQMQDALEFHKNRKLEKQDLSRQVSGTAQESRDSGNHFDHLSFTFLEVASLISHLWCF